MRKKLPPRKISRREFLQAAVNVDQAFAECKRRGIPASPEAIREILQRKIPAKRAVRGLTRKGL